ncbi:MAG: hypothetical protein HY716_00350 [Planctomycetes bacterium]|nr:hypothetical protein [Planctomycetota bacterium]
MTADSLSSPPPFVITLIVGLSILLQLTAAGLAFRLRAIRGRRWAGLLIAIALMLLTVQKGIVFTLPAPPEPLPSPEPQETKMVTDPQEYAL